MTVLEKIKTMLPEFSKNERRIADHILKYPYDLERYSGIAIAETCNVSRSAVIRFCQKLGFTGYSDFQKAVLSEPKQTSVNTEDGQFHSLQVYRSCIDHLQEHTDETLITAVAERLTHANRVLSFGEKHSGYSAKQLAFRLARNRIDCTYTDDSSVLQNYIDIYGAGDMAVIFSITGQKKFGEILDRFRKKRVTVILLTMNANSSLTDSADYVVVLPSAVHSDSPYLLDEAIVFMLWIEMLVESIQKQLGDI